MPIANIILKLWVAGSVDRANSNWFSWVLRRCLEAEQFWRKKTACSAYCMLSIWLTDQFHNLALRWQLQRQRKCLHNWYPLIGLIKIGLPFGYLGKPKHRLATIVFHCVFPFTNAPDVQSCSAVFFTRAIQVGLFEKWLQQNLVVARTSCCWLFPS